MARSAYPEPQDSKPSLDWMLVAVAPVVAVVVTVQQEQPEEPQPDQPEPRSNSRLGLCRVSEQMLSSLRFRNWDLLNDQALALRTSSNPGIDEQRRQQHADHRQGNSKLS